MVGLLTGVPGGAAVLLLLSLHCRGRKDSVVFAPPGGDYMAAWYFLVDGGLAL